LPVVDLGGFKNDRVGKALSWFKNFDLISEGILKQVKNDEVKNGVLRF
jgi:hypothetical protein